MDERVPSLSLEAWASRGIFVSMVPDLRAFDII
jgi:hypothetical protein